ncbi:heavy metal-(Cd/Co/Hg/Pb/Zn)-translocating P-type ATPase [Rhodoglobus vestalii]|uniref:Heavy metal-(Cd/Co/Hg/Pb/Zn)-translocating P-type ATPase n=1 Tax=Rhodoglobus vestalii TaxID=193384 RepID=A0A8H2K628_9MICO|nr:heavy metal translocating P-type ATPase [Rhodoglobus vestalii]TQO20503.1 heavy metal-(Cd/Co/Hg/Pb/Zn)-translocating P-type ATPase [Rhodoglobus vestalii]
MTTLVAAVRRYPLVALTVVVGVVGLALNWTPASAVVPWLLSGYSLVVAAREAVSMIRRLFRKEFGLDVLAVTAIIATVLVGEYWASIVIVLMLTGGEALEDFAAGRAQRELKALLSRVPQIAHVFDDSGELVDVPVTAVTVGERLVVRPSEIVPVDAVLVSASTAVDESSLTGESMPVDKVAGDLLLSGSVNGPEAVTVTAAARASESQYQRIVQLVSEAAASKPALVRLADRYAAPFTFVSVALAGIAWWLSGDPTRFAEVLVVATPCPLLIAAPVAFMAGMSSASAHGVVIKNAGTLEVLARAKTVVFDKTGTLTRGTPEVVAIRPESGRSEEAVLTLVAAAEQYSSHVLAASLVAEARRRGYSLPAVTDAREVATHGVQARIGTEVITVGKPAFVAEQAPGLAQVDLGSGEAAVYVAVDDQLAGVIILRDAVRDEAQRMLHDLQALGIQKTLMVTGDIEQTAQKVADELQLSEVHAECLPEDKVRIVHTITPGPVVMVGDGVNDAPVLAAADVGIAMGAKGSTAASESADIVILVDDLYRVVDAVSVSKRTVYIALQSIWIGIAISIALMLVAMTGVMPAIVGAALQEVVDLVTILNALRALNLGRNAGSARVASDSSSPLSAGAR